MGDIENLRNKNIMIIMIIVFNLFLQKPDYKHVKLFIIVCKNGMISDNYHDIEQLLLLKIIVDSKNWKISIIYCQRKYHG